MKFLHVRNWLTAYIADKRKIRREINIGLSIAIILFIILAVLVHKYPVLNTDVEVSEELQEHSYPLLDSIMKAISFFGNQWVAITEVIFTAGILYINNFRKAALFTMLTLSGSVITAVIKIIIHRPRPTASLVRIVSSAKAYSFPSGHTVHYIVFFGFLTYLMWQIKNIRYSVRVIVTAICLALICSIPFSRVYLGDHWASDVTGGFLLGLFLLCGLIFIYNKQVRGTDRHN